MTSYAPLTPDQIEATRSAMARHQRADGTYNYTRIADDLGIVRSSATRRVESLLEGRYSEPIAAPEPAIRFPFVPSEDEPIDSLIDRLTRQAERYIAADEARDSMCIDIGTDRPTVLAFIGDPHLGTHCNWPLLREHIALLKRPHVHAVSIGDVADNWTGNLIRLYAEADISRKSERRLAKWFLQDAGIRWLLWIFGNHDEWNDGADFLRAINRPGIAMESWGAKFRVRFSTGLEVPVWTAHDFPGSSQWNKLHALMKAAMMRGGASIYVAGHRHTWGLHEEEIPDTGAVYVAMRAKGYKIADPHARRLGFGKEVNGSTMAVVIDPRKSGYDAVTPFSDLAKAVAYRDGLDSSRTCSTAAR